MRLKTLWFQVGGISVHNQKPLKARKISRPSQSGTSVSLKDVQQWEFEQAWRGEATEMQFLYVVSIHSFCIHVPGTSPFRVAPGACVHMENNKHFLFVFKYILTHFPHFYKWSTISINITCKASYKN